MDEEISKKFEIMENKIVETRAIFYGMLKDISRENHSHKRLIDSKLDAAIENLKSHEQFLKNAEQRIFTAIEQEVRVQFSEAGIRGIVTKVIKNSIYDNNFKDLVSMVLDAIFKTMKKQLSLELNNVKNLCYSIESEIKHTIVKIPMSYTDSQMIDKKLRNVLDKMLHTTKLTVEKKKVIEYG